MTDPDWLGPERRLTHLPPFRQLLRDANREFAEPANEAAAFRKLSERLSASERTVRGLRLALPIAALAIAGMLLLLPRIRAERSPVPLAAAEFPRHVSKLASSGSSLAREPAPEGREAAQGLVSGTQRLRDGSVATVSPGSSARVEETRDTTLVLLSGGSIELDVVEQAPGRRFEVSTDGYRFSVLGTMFEIQVAKGSVRLEVREGRVGVWKDQTLLARVSAGESWDNRAFSPAPARSAGTRRASSGSFRSSADGAVATEEPDCLSLARQGATHEAQACFLGRAAGSGIGAEMALYEVARLRRDVLRDPAGALRALDQYRQRFPTGSLRREADMSYLELLVQLGRSAEAIDQSSVLLASGSGHERVAELRVLRGDIFRRDMNDMPAAEREYALAEGLTGAASTEAIFLRGVCLEALGDRQAAAAAFERYLERSPRPRSEEAQRRLESLRRE